MHTYVKQLHKEYLTLTHSMLFLDSVSLNPEITDWLDGLAWPENYKDLSLFCFSFTQHLTNTVCILKILFMLMLEIQIQIILLFWQTLYLLSHFYSLIVYIFCPNYFSLIVSREREKNCDSICFKNVFNPCNLSSRFSLKVIW